MSIRQSNLAIATTVVFLFATRVGEAAAPTGHYTTVNGTVYDTKSKLTWQQGLSGGLLTQAAAQSYCSSLVLFGTGWRLPTIKELLSIVDLSQPAAPYIDQTAFTAESTTNRSYWSATPGVGVTPAAAWYVTFSTGETKADAVTSSYNVRCVR